VRESLEIGKAIKRIAIAYPVPVYWCDLVSPIEWEAEMMKKPDASGRYFSEGVDRLTPPPGMKNWRQVAATSMKVFLTNNLHARSIDPKIAEAVAEVFVELLKNNPSTPGAILPLFVETADKFSEKAPGLQSVWADFVASMAISARKKCLKSVRQRNYPELLNSIRLFHQLMWDDEALIRALAEKLNTSTEERFLLAEREVVRNQVRGKPVSADKELEELLAMSWSLPLEAKLDLLVECRSSASFRKKLLSTLEEEATTIEGLRSHQARAVSEMCTVQIEEYEHIKSMVLVSAELGDMKEKFGDVITPAADTDKLEMPPKLPATLYAALRKKIVSHTSALKTLSVLVFEHYLKFLEKIVPVDPKPLVLLFVGPSGSGKTHITRTVSELLDLPFVHVNVSSLVGSGIVGTTLADTLDRLHVLEKEDARRSSFGVVFFDEIDKICRDGSHDQLSYAKTIQSELLMFMEGETVRIPGHQREDKKDVFFDTSNLLIVLGGAFDGIEEIVAKRIQRDRTIGFGTGGGSEQPAGEHEESLYLQVTKADLLEYGFMPELLGRIGTIANLENLRKEDLLEILHNPLITPFQEHHQYFKAISDSLKVDEAVLEYLADLAANSKFGVRRLKTLVDSILFELKFLAANQTREEIHLTLDFAKKQLEKEAALLE